MIYKCLSCAKYNCSEQCRCELQRGRPTSCMVMRRDANWVAVDLEDIDTSWIEPGIWCYDHNEGDTAYIAEVSEAGATLLYHDDTDFTKTVSLSYIADCCGKRGVQQYSFRSAEPVVKIIYRNGHKCETTLIAVADGYWDVSNDEEISYADAAKCLTSDHEAVGECLYEISKEDCE